MRIELLEQSLAHVNAMRAGAPDYEKLTGYRLAEGLQEMVAGPEVSPEFVARQQQAIETDIWLHGFAIVDPEAHLVVGVCGYKGPPTAEGIVEIAYGLAPACRGRGYATEAAKELVQRALATDLVSRVIAHTLPESNASTRILARCGFTCLGEVIDPQDGRVWRWEKTR